MLINEYAGSGGDYAALDVPAGEVSGNLVGMRTGAAASADTCPIQSFIDGGR
jgi:hypothetical protein